MKRAITIELTDEAYQMIYRALEQHDDLAAEHTVRSWLETELNDNTEAIVEMLLEDY